MNAAIQLSCVFEPVRVTAKKKTVTTWHGSFHIFYYVQYF